MPLVRISSMGGKPQEFGKKVGEIVYLSMVDTINVPVKDHFQVITEHNKDGLIYDSNYLNIQRTDGVIFIQITLNEERNVGQIMVSALIFYFNILNQAVTQIHR